MLLCAHSINGRLENQSWKRRDATNNDITANIEKKTKMNTGTSASPENLTCNKAASIRRKPTAEEYNNLCAVDFGLDWHEDKIIPTNIQPAPIFFRNTTPTLTAS